VNPWEQISVVMIVRNAASVMTAAIRSIPPGTDLVVADGGSTDDTSLLAEKLGARVVFQDLDEMIWPAIKRPPRPSIPGSCFWMPTND
jgi:hypothetical protein